MLDCWLTCVAAGRLDAVLRREVGRVQYEPTDRAWFAHVPLFGHRPSAIVSKDRSSRRSISIP